MALLVAVRDGEDGAARRRDFPMGDAPILAGSIGGPVFFVSDGPGWARIFAVARLRGLGETSSGRVRLQIIGYQHLVRPIASGMPSGDFEVLDAAATAVLLAAVTGAGDPGPGLAEPATPFFYAETQGGGGLWRAVLDAYGERCAFTGEGEPETGLDMVAIRPLGDGGPARISNMLPAVPEVALAFEEGHLLIDRDLGLYAALARIAPELLERLNPIGRLRPPSDPRAVPDAQALAWRWRQARGD